MELGLSKVRIQLLEVCRQEIVQIVQANAITSKQVRDDQNLSNGHVERLLSENKTRSERLIAHRELYIILIDHFDMVSMMYRVRYERIDIRSEDLFSALKEALRIISRSNWTKPSDVLELVGSQIAVSVTVNGLLTVEVSPELWLEPFRNSLLVPIPQ